MRVDRFWQLTGSAEKEIDISLACHVKHTGEDRKLDRFKSESVQPTRASLCVTNAHPTDELSLARGGGFEQRWSIGVLKESTTKAVLKACQGVLRQGTRSG